MFTYQILVEYSWTKFFGWQKQKKGKTVQGTLESVLSKFLKEKIKVIGSGRTDSGVHALAQSAHFKSKIDIKNKDNFINSANYFLKKNPISILNVKKRSSKFHARHSALERLYQYIIINRQSSLILEKNKAWHVKKKLNLNVMKKGAEILRGTHNFSTFRASSCQAKSPIRNLKKVLIKKNKNKIILFFQSQSFLQQQVRSMVGSLKYLGEGKWDIDKFTKNFKSRKRSNCAPPAPPQGLYLFKVYYWKI